ncbi:MAG: acyl-CoA dehydrogenase family protein [Deltaproteobacteria bacterium]
MSLPDRNNPYSFDAFLEALNGFDFYLDNPFVQRAVKHFVGEEWPQLHGKLKAFSSKLSFRWKDLADHVGRPELRPYIEHYDAHRHRVDRIVRPGESKILEKEITSEALFSEKTTAWEQFGKQCLLHQIGEAGIMCPMGCTEGLIAISQAFVDQSHPEVRRILEHCKEGIDGEFGLGAQFMSEIQGGSDIPSNLVEAVPEGDHYRIYGNKFFCSAAHTDYTVITAKVTGTDQEGTFVIPSWLPGNKEKEIRNDYRIVRLKRKLGTVEVPTAEIDFDGAVAYAVGPTDRGVANAVGIVLTLSRITVGASSAAFMMRAAREAMLYSEFRDVFGAKISQFPMAAGPLRYLIYDLFIRQGRHLQGGLPAGGSPEERKERFNLRELIILQKLCSAHEAVDVIRKAMSIFGGHGVMEDFSSLPRLFRDSTVNELWEGPKNVLLMQVFRDLERVSPWYPPREFVADILDRADQDFVDNMADVLEDFLNKPPFVEINPESIERAARWDAFCGQLFKAYQEQALEEIGKVPVISQDKSSQYWLWV